MGLREIANGELGAVEAERALVGSIVLDPDRLHDALAEVSPDDVSDTEARLVFAACAACDRHSREITPETLRDEMQAAGAWHAARGVEGVASLIDAGRLQGHVVDLLAGIVRQWARARRMGLALAACGSRAPSSAREVPAYLDAVSESIHAAATDARAGAAADIGDIAADVLATVEGTEPGVQWCLPSLRRFGGMQPGNLVILAARPKRGKSALALQQALHTAADRPVLFVSCEMSKREVGARALSIAGRIDGDATMRRRMYTEAEMESAIAATQALSRMRLVVLDRAGATLAEVRSLARKIRAQHGDLALIVLDYLQLMTPPERRKGGTREEEVSQLSRGAKQLAGELNCAVLALSQLNRAADGQRPKLSHLRESGAIEQDANSILFLHSEGEGEAGALTSEGEVIVAAQRSGPTGAAPVLFRNAWTTFIDVAAGDVAGARESSPDLDDFDNPGGYAVGGYTGNVVPMRRHGSDE